MLEYRHLRYFIEVGRLQHVTRAAANLHIAQPALSQNIRQLEHELGVTLFLRQKKRLTLTDAGRAYLAEAVKTVEQFENAKWWRRERNAAKRGSWQSDSERRRG